MPGGVPRALDLNFLTIDSSIPSPFFLARGVEIPRCNFGGWRGAEKCGERAKCRHFRGRVPLIKLFNF